MKVEYDRETDTLTIKLREARIKESDEVRPGVIADFSYDGGVVGFEILEASRVVEKTQECLFAVEESPETLAAVREKPNKPYGQ